MKLPRRTDLPKVNWKQFKYIVFDIPHHPGTYAERYNALGTISNFLTDIYVEYPFPTHTS